MRPADNARVTRKDTRPILPDRNRRRAERATTITRQRQRALRGKGSR